MDIKYTSDSNENLDYHYKKKYGNTYERNHNEKYGYSHRRNNDIYTLDEYTTSALSYEEFPKRPLLTSPESKSEYRHSKKYQYRERHNRHKPDVDYNFPNRGESGKKRSKLTKHPKYDDSAYDVPTRDVYYQYETNKENTKKKAKSQSVKRGYDYNNYRYEEPHSDNDFREHSSEIQMKKKRPNKKYKFDEKYDDEKYYDERRHKKSQFESQNKKEKDYQVFAYKDSNFHERGFKMKEKSLEKTPHKPKLSENVVKHSENIHKKSNVESKEIELRTVDYPLLGFKGDGATDSGSELVYLPVIVFDKQSKLEEGPEAKQTKSTTQDKNTQNMHVYAANVQDQRNIFKPLESNNNQTSRNVSHKKKLFHEESSVTESQKQTKVKSSKETQTEESSVDRSHSILKTQQYSPHILGSLIHESITNPSKMKIKLSKGTRVSNKDSPGLHTNSLAYQVVDVDSGKKRVSKGMEPKTDSNNIIRYNIINTNPASLLHDDFPVTKDYIKVNDMNSASTTDYGVLSQLKPNITMVQTKISPIYKTKKNETNESYSVSQKYVPIYEITSGNKAMTAHNFSYSQKQSPNDGVVSRNKKGSDQKYFSHVHSISPSDINISQNERKRIEEQKLLANMQDSKEKSRSRDYLVMASQPRQLQVFAATKLGKSNINQASVVSDKYMPMAIDNQSKSQKYQYMDSRHGNDRDSHIIANHNYNHDEFGVKSTPESVNLSPSDVSNNQRERVEKQNLSGNIQDSKEEKRSRNYFVMASQPEQLQVFAATALRKSNIHEASMARDDIPKKSMVSNVSQLRRSQNDSFEERLNTQKQSAINNKKSVSTKNKKMNSDEAFQQFTQEVFPDYTVSESLKETSTVKQPNSSVGGRDKKSIVGRKSRSEIGRKSRSTIDRKSKSEIGRKSRSEIGMRNQSEIGRKSKSGIRQKSKSGIRKKSKSGIRQKSKSGIRQKSQSGIRQKSQSGKGRDSKSVTGRKSKSEVGRKSKSVARKSKEPHSVLQGHTDSVDKSEKQAQRKSTMNSATTNEPERRSTMKSTVKEVGRSSVNSNMYPESKQTTNPVTSDLDDKNKTNIAEIQSDTEGRKSKKGLSRLFFKRSKSTIKKDNHSQRSRQSRAKKSNAGLKMSSNDSRDTISTGKASTKKNPEGKSFAESGTKSKSKSKVWSFLKRSKEKDKTASKSAISRSSKKAEKNDPADYSEEEVKSHDLRTDSETKSKQKSPSRTETQGKTTSSHDQKQKQGPVDKEQQCQCFTKYMKQARDCSDFFLGTTLHQQVMNILKVM